MNLYDLKPDVCQEDKIGVSYSAGSHRGILHLGVIQAFIELKIIPDYIVGVSAGSFAAAVHAFDPKDLKAIELTKRVAKTLSPGDFGLNIFSIAGRVVVENFSLQSLGSFKKFKEIITHNIPFHDFSETQVPFAISTTDRLSGQQVWLSEGDVPDAIEASSALPGIFPPVQRGDKVYVDGGVTDGMPLLHLAEQGCGTIFAISAGYSGATPKPPKNLLENALGSIDISLYQASRYEAALIKALYPKLKVIEIRPNVAFDVSLFNFTTDKIDSVVEESHKRSLELLKPYS